MGKTHITVFEHEALYVDKGERLDTGTLDELQVFHGKSEIEYFKLIHRGIRFKEYVGVLQVGDTTIEILPKADKQDDATKWRSVLIGMLRSVGMFDIHAPSSSALQLKPNSILDLYFELFIREVEYLQHQGLIKKYVKHEANATSLKGSLYFPKHIQQNMVHQERFYVRYTTYDTRHLLHQILYKCLLLLKKINTNHTLNSRIGALLLNFPEQADCTLSEASFHRISFDRKSDPYRKAVEIAGLLLLNFHPDLSKGSKHVLALMFDMNLLWEKFVYVSLRKHKPLGTKVLSQSKKSFWKPEKGNNTTIRPDILIHFGNGEAIVLDTKWKNLYGRKPSSDDLRQMYVYNQYFGAKRSALVYPGPDSAPLLGQFFEKGTKQVSDDSCSLIPIHVNRDVAQWQKDIHKKISSWVS